MNVEVLKGNNSKVKNIDNFLAFLLNSTVVLCYSTHNFLSLPCCCCDLLGKRLAAYSLPPIVSSLGGVSVCSTNYIISDCLTTFKLCLMCNDFTVVSGTLHSTCSVISTIGLLLA